MESDKLEKEHKVPLGAPALYTDPEELAERIVLYFMQFVEQVEEDKKVEKLLMFWELRPTITGLTLFLGFESRQSFYDYQEKPAFSYAIKRARLQIESIYENMLGTKTGTVGAIFALKNMSWSDKQEIDHTTKGEKMEAVPPINVYNQAPPMASDESEVETKQN